MNSMRWRTPSLRSALPFLSLAALCLVAATWQWRRAEYKEHLATELQLAQARDARPLAGVLDTPGTAPSMRVKLKGRIDIERIILLDNRIRDGQYGVDVYAPLRDADDRWILVGLGWIAADRSRRQSPKLPSLISNIDTVAMLQSPPAPGLRLGADAIAEPVRYPLLLSRIDIVSLRDLFNLPTLADRVAVLEADDGSGFVRSWELPGMTADRHRGYALQWLSFAIGTLVFFILWHRPRKDSRS